jgi:leader peptidase (prepilin peptidase)/N-methyltransferase
LPAPDFHQWITVEYLLLAWGLVTVSFIDIDHMILPDKFTLSGIAVLPHARW